jgi:hypothetical protein
MPTPLDSPLPLREGLRGGDARGSAPENPIPYAPYKRAALREYLLAVKKDSLCALPRADPSL